MNIGPWQLAIVAILILVLFGRGRISEMMGDFGKGIKSFKQGMNEEARTQDRIDHQSPAPKAGETTATPTPTASGDSEKSS